jgi:hypothetical protein
MTTGDGSLASLIELLGRIPSGKATVSVGGHPVLSIDADSKTLEVEANGVADAGLRISDLFKLQEGRAAMIEAPVHITGALSRLGWKLTLYAGGDRVLSMGSGVSRLTGHVSMNPLKLKKILKALG